MAYTRRVLGMNLGATLNITTVRRGDRGEQVRYIQDLLNIHGANPKLVKDAIFGPLTEKAVKAFQAVNRLSVTGIVDSITLTGLESENSKDIPKATVKPTPTPIKKPAVIAPTIPGKVIARSTVNWKVVGIVGAAVAVAGLAIRAASKRKPAIAAA